MHAEISPYFVTFYGSGSEKDRAVLRKIFDAAIRSKITAGSVGVFQPPSDSDVYVFVGIRADHAEALSVLREAGLRESDFMFEDVDRVPLEESDVESVGERSCANRKKRLHR